MKKSTHVGKQKQH